ncbi:MAG: aminodeoxychorismate synthase component I [Parashewanella sp.]
MVTRTSTRLAVRQIDLTLTTTEVFEHFSHLPWAILLDSADSDHPNANYDIISFAPVATLTTIESSTRFTPLCPSIAAVIPEQVHDETPFAVLKHYLTQLYPNKLECQLPFAGGAMGSFSYDLGRQLETLPETANKDISLPEMNIGLYDWALIFCYKSNSWNLVSYLGEAALELKLNELKSYLSITSKQDSFKLTTPWNAQITQQHYQQKFFQIQEYLLSGDCYQINLTQRFSANYSGDEWAAYTRLRSKNKGPFSAFIRLPQHTVLSISPERFIQRHGDFIETKPIKGTLPRNTDPLLDKQAAEQLRNSTKDRAENLMITDLLRNDLGKVAKAGSVKVPSLFEIESFPAVHHLVSTVTAVLRDDLDATDILHSSFPGGSITGAPKFRAMEIIEELEPSRRSIYCGSIGYISQHGIMDTSITIRTLLTEKQTIYCWAGGGIVADSNVDCEYQESFDKVSKILPILTE